MNANFEREMDPERLWHRADRLLADRGPATAAHIEAQIAGCVATGDEENAIVWKALRWRVDELRRRARSEAIKANPFGF